MAEGNLIPVRQNEPWLLDVLAAQRHLYTKAKSILFAEFILSVPMVMTITTLALFVPAAQPWAVLWALVTSIIIIFFLEPWRKQAQSQAAVTQELFDCQLLELPWKELKTGPKPPPETIEGAARAYKKKYNSVDDLRDWYPPAAGQLPLYLGRIICQRVNCTWERKLRRYYVVGIGIVMGLCSLLILAISLQMELTLKELCVTFIGLTLPAWIIGLRQIQEHQGFADSNERLASHAYRLLDDAKSHSLTPELFTNQSRDLQDEIFERRRTAPPLFDWVYRRLRAPNDEEMNRAAEKIVNQLRAKHS